MRSVGSSPTIPHLPAPLPADNLLPLEPKVKISRKKIWQAVALLTFLTIIAAIGWAALTRAPEQIITLPDGHQYRLAGVTWGTNHNQPRLLAHLVDHLPGKLPAYFRAKLSPRITLLAPIRTPSPALIVWVEPIGTKATTPGSPSPLAGLKAMLADENGVRSGMLDTPIVSDATWTVVKFDEVPRRSRMLDCQFLHLDAYGWTADPILHLQFRNPLFGHFPQWQPEPLPATKTVGDLRVQLNDVATKPEPAGNGRARVTVFSLAINPAQTNHSWKLDGTELSDATGNRIGEFFPSPAGQDTYLIRGALWPNEPALRLKLSLKHLSSFPTTDLVTFTNLPLLPSTPGTTNGTALTNVMDGIPVVARNFAQDPAWAGAQPGYCRVEVEASGAAVEVVDMVTDTGDKMTHREEGSPLAPSLMPPPALRILSPIPAGAKFVTITVAIEKERVVEFLVKPEELK